MTIFPKIIIEELDLEIKKPIVEHFKMITDNFSKETICEMTHYI